MTTGECGRFPPSTACQIAVLCFTNRLHHMSNDKLVKKVYCVLMELNDQGFATWATDALKLVNDLGLDLNDVQKNFASMLYKVIILRLGLQSYMISNPIQS